jgi:hypothetical protein
MHLSFKKTFMKAIKGKIIWITWSQLRTKRKGWIVDGYGCINGNEWEFIENHNFPKLTKNPHNRTFGKIAKGREMDPSTI